MRPSQSSSMPFVQFVSGPGEQQLLEPPRQTPPEHVSLLVQALPSSQGALLGAKVHPVPLQASSVQTLPSLQVNAMPAHTPLAQVSLRVQRLPSSQEAALGVKVHPEPLHASLVQTLPSSQVNGVPEQTPLAHVSLRVQRLPSLHGAVLGGKLHPPAPSQTLLVQTFPSSQV